MSDYVTTTISPAMRVVRVAGDDGELRPWHYVDVYSIESRLIKDSKCTEAGGEDALDDAGPPFGARILLELLHLMESDLVKSFI